MKKLIKKALKRNEEYIMLVGIILIFCANNWGGKILGILFFLSWFIMPLIYKNK